MPVVVRKRGPKYRVVEASTGNLAKNKAGTPLDGNGHASRASASNQAKAVNSSKGKK